MDEVAADFRAKLERSQNRRVLSRQRNELPGLDQHNLCVGLQILPRLFDSRRPAYVQLLNPCCLAQPKCEYAFISGMKTVSGRQLFAIRDAFAEQAAATWTKGQEAWGQDGERIQIAATTRR